MAKFRTNHDKKRAAASGGMIIRIGLFSLIVGSLIFFFRSLREQSPVVEPPVTTDVENLATHGLDSIFYLPASGEGKLIRHRYFALSYREEHGLADWVAYELTSERVTTSTADSLADFHPDPKIAIAGSVTPAGIRLAGYECGHLVAPAEMVFSPDALSESYYMANVVPQAPGFSQSIGKTLVGQTLDWAKKFNHLYVVAGPIMNGEAKVIEGENQMVIPTAFFRVVLDLHHSEKKAIAFIIPNEASHKPLAYFATTIDSVEVMTGIDFFPNLLSKPLEEQLEAHFDLKLWPVTE